MHEREPRDLVGHLRYEPCRNAVVDGVEHGLNVDVRHGREDVESELTAENGGQTQDVRCGSGEPRNPIDERLAHTCRHTNVTVLDVVKDFGDKERVAASPFVEQRGHGGIRSITAGQFTDLTGRKPLEMNSGHAAITS